MAYDYDVIVIGAGAAGLTASGICASFGAKTLMIERHRLGGDCTWTGCVPSKALLKSAQVAHTIRHASDYGLLDGEPQFDFGQLMERLRTIRQTIYDDADAPELYEAMGIEVRLGTARFIDPHTIALTDRGGTDRLSARLFIVAAGARPSVPPIDGLEATDYLTNETLFELTEQPGRLAILGAGPIGTEMAQAFTRLGTQVTVLDRADRILQHDDAELAEMLRTTLEGEGVAYRFGASVERVEQADGLFQIHLTQDGDTATVEADALLVATGRQANVDGLGLDAAGVAYTDDGITVDDRCRTSQRHIYAVGDVTGRYQFTHMSEHMAKVAATNAVLKVPMSIDTEHVPWVTYTDPELAHVGSTREALDEAGTSYETYRFPYEKVDRAVTEGATTGLIKVYAKPLTGAILGADVLGVSAGELISEYAVAMKNGVTLRQIADTIHPYPSYGLAARRAADQWYARKQSAGVTRTVQALFGYRGPVTEPDPDRIV